MKQKSQDTNNRSFWQNPITIILSTAALFFATQIIGSAIVFSLKPYIQNQNYQMLLFVTTNIFVFIGMLTTAMAIFKFNWSQVGFNKTKLSDYLKTIPAFFIYFSFSVGFTALATRFIPGFEVDQVQELGFSTNLNSSEMVAAFLTLVIITPIFEEIVFRGILFRGIRRRIPFWAAAVVTSLVFAIAHGQLNIAIDTFALSLILCYLVEKTNSIYPSILLHGLKNGLAFVILYVV